MSKYKINKDDDGDAIPCRCCDCQVPTRLFKDLHTEFRDEPYQDYYLCEVCSSTFLSYAVCYPSQCDRNDLLWKSIARIANMILRAIKEKK